ncbi:hypothetical protein ABKN59_011969 [Abortiporus biennis]
MRHICFHKNYTSPIFIMFFVGRYLTNYELKGYSGFKMALRNDDNAHFIISLPNSNSSPDAPNYALTSKFQGYEVILFNGKTLGMCATHALNLDIRFVYSGLNMSPHFSMFFKFFSSSVRLHAMSRFYMMVTGN